jgi:hypothetical protein
MECPHGEPRGEMFCPFCRREKGIVFVSPDKRKPVASNSVRVGASHPDTSINAARKALPRSGTKKKIVYELIKSKGIFGMCDHEIEQELNWTHQSASSSRNTLMNDLWVEDSGMRRETPQGNPAIVWVAL